MATRMCVFSTMLLWLTASVSAALPFASEVVEYTPAPGQFVNIAELNDPSRALGAPVGGGTYDADSSSVVSLGGFGGTLVLAFDHTVMDDASNPLGLDAIVFGNASYVGGDPARRWAECGVIEISRDANGNGQADDAWYLIPGSHLAAPAQRAVQTWDDDIADTTYPPLAPPSGTNPNWIPPGASGEWTTTGFLLPEAVFNAVVLVNPNGVGADEEGVWGYADHAPTLILGDLDADNLVDDAAMTAEAFYTVPDDPDAVGVTARSGGGDAFDIAWAVDPATGALANLDGFDFIRIRTGVNYVAGVFGEISTEIDAVADVHPGPADMNCDGAVNAFDIDPFVTALVDRALYEAAYPECFWFNGDANGDGAVNAFDIDAFVQRLVGG